MSFMPDLRVGLPVPNQRSEAVVCACGLPKPFQQARPPRADRFRMARTHPAPADISAFDPRKYTAFVPAPSVWPPPRPGRPIASRPLPDKQHSRIPKAGLRDAAGSDFFPASRTNARSGLPFKSAALITQQPFAEEYGGQLPVPNPESAWTVTRRSRALRTIACSRSPLKSKESAKFKNPLDNSSGMCIIIFVADQWMQIRN